VKPEEIIHKNILFSALNWGMGHVARSISIIDQLLKQGNKVTIAASNQQRQIYTTYFPSINFVLHEDYPFNFGAKGNFGLDLVKSSGTLFQRYRKERAFVEKYVFENAIDLVLSDHRYGFYSNKVTSIFITHQINLPLSFFEKPIQLLHKKLLRNFNEIWVLDTEESEFAGKLSKKTRGIICTYIGIQSRFKLYSIPVKKTIDSYTLVHLFPTIMSYKVI
jgi:UDP:flavonoid glycosyltransferase YjiC (YdhE family)